MKDALKSFFIVVLGVVLAQGLVRVEPVVAQVLQGTMSQQFANNVAITGGSITGITDLAVADGGTGASTAAGAATNLAVLPTAGGTMTGNVTFDATTSKGIALTNTGDVPIRTTVDTGALVFYADEDSDGVLDIGEQVLIALDSTADSTQVGGDNDSASGLTVTKAGAANLSGNFTFYGTSNTFPNQSDSLQSLADDAATKAINFKWFLRPDLYDILVENLDNYQQTATSNGTLGHFSGSSRLRLNNPIVAGNYLGVEALFNCWSPTASVVSSSMQMTDEFRFSFSGSFAADPADTQALYSFPSGNTDTTNMVPFASTDSTSSCLGVWRNADANVYGVLLRAVRVSTMARTSNVVTVDCVAAHGLQTNDYVLIVSTGSSDYNAYYTQVTYVDTDTFTYASTGADGSASGTFYCCEIKTLGSPLTLSTSGGLFTGNRFNAVLQYNGDGTGEVFLNGTSAGTTTELMTSAQNSLFTGHVYCVDGGSTTDAYIGNFYLQVR